MKLSIAPLSLSILTLSAASFAHATHCYVVGQDPQSPQNYDQLIKNFPDVQFAAQGQILMTQDQTVISYSKDSDGNLSVGLSDANSPTLFSMAIGGATGVQLVDAQRKLAVLCK